MTIRDDDANSPLDNGAAVARPVKHQAPRPPKGVGPWMEAS